MGYRTHLASEPIPRLMPLWQAYELVGITPEEWDDRDALVLVLDDTGNQEAFIIGHVDGFLSSLADETAYVWSEHDNDSGDWCPWSGTVTVEPDPHEKEACPARCRRSRAVQRTWSRSRMTR